MSWKDKYASEQKLRLGARRMTVKMAPKDFWMTVQDAGEFSGVDRHGTPYSYDYVAGPVDALGNEQWAVALNRSSAQLLVAKGYDEKSIIGQKVHFQVDSFVDMEGHIVKYIKAVSVKEGK